jgi:hypothetical protein
VASGAISFWTPLASAPSPDILAHGFSDAHCPGSSTVPTAEPGYLCIYEGGLGTCQRHQRLRPAQRWQRWCQPLRRRSRNEFRQRDVRRCVRRRHLGGHRTLILRPCGRVQAPPVAAGPARH